MTRVHVDPVPRRGAVVEQHAHARPPRAAHRVVVGRARDRRLRDGVGAVQRIVERTPARVYRVGANRRSAAALRAADPLGEIFRVDVAVVDLNAVVRAAR